MTWVNIENGENALSIRNKINALGADVDTKTEQSDFNGLVSTVGTKADLASGKVPESQIPSFVKTDSYMAWVTNTNTNALDAAFGKNNDTLMKYIGAQLAMYSWYKGDSNVTYPYTNLKNISTFTAILAATAAYNEIRCNQNLINLIMSSPYAQNAAKDIIPIIGDIPCYQSPASGFFAMNTSAVATYTISNITVNRSGYYRIKFSYDNPNLTITLKKNGVNLTVITNSTAYSYSQDILLLSGDVLLLTMTTTAYNFWWMVSPIYLCTLKSIIIPTTPTVGTRIIVYTNGYRNNGATISGTTDTITVPNTGSYRLAFSVHGTGGNNGCSMDLKVNGVLIQNLFSLGGGDNHSCNAYSFDRTFNANDVITITYSKGTTGYFTYSGATLSATATDNFPA